jgi:Cu(I)/Ag(I) efflux system protein CusF
MKLGRGWGLISTLVVGLAGCGAGKSTAPQREAPAAEASAPSVAAEPARGVGVIEAVNASAGTVTISHQPIESLGWPAMTMPFKVANPDLLKHVTVGEKVEFALDGKDMSASITSLDAAR